MDTPRYIVVQEQERPPFAVRDLQAAICGEVARCWTRQDAERIAALLNADPCRDCPAEAPAGWPADPEAAP